MTSFTYTKFIEKLLNGGGIDLDSDTIKVALLTSAYTPAKTHGFFSDLTNEVTGTGYSAGGASLANKTVTRDDTNFYATFDADDVTWPTSTITARYAVIYKSTGVAGTSPLIALIDLGSDLSTSVSTFTLPFNASGIFRLAITV